MQELVHLVEQPVDGRLCIRLLFSPSVPHLSEHMLVVAGLGLALFWLPSLRRLSRQEITWIFWPSSRLLRCVGVLMEVLVVRATIVE